MVNEFIYIIEPTINAIYTAYITIVVHQWGRVNLIYDNYNYREVELILW